MESLNEHSHLIPKQTRRIRYILPNDINNHSDVSHDTSEDSAVGLGVSIIVPQQPLDVEEEPSRSLGSLTVEPALALVCFGVALSQIYETKILVDKACSFYYFYPDEVCNHLDSGNYTKEQENVQRFANRYLTYENLIEFIPGMYFSLVMGVWCDVRGRTFPLIFSYFSCFLLGLIYIINSYWFSLPPAWVLLARVPVALSGGGRVVDLTAFAYITDKCNTRARSLRMAFILIGLYASFPVAVYLGAYLYKKGGYLLVFGTQTVSYAAAFLYVVCYSIIEARKPSTGDTVARADARQQKVPIKKVFSPFMLWESVAAAFRTEEWKRKQIIGYTVAFALLTFALEAWRYCYLYTRLKFGWDYEDYTMLMIVGCSFGMFGACCVVPTLSFGLRLPDAWLCLAGTLTRAVQDAVQGFATSPRQMFMATTANMVGGMTVFTYTRSALSKLVGRDRYGSVLAVLAVVQCIVPVLSSLTDTLLYNATIAVFPGALFVVAAVVHVGAAATIWWLIRAGRRSD